MLDHRILDYRCAFLIEVAEQPARFFKDVDLQLMLGKAQEKPNKSQIDRARAYRASQRWPTTCRNTKGRGGIATHDAVALGWRGQLSAEHFYEPWHLYCKRCADADADAQGHGRWQPDEGAKPPPSWNAGDPYPDLATRPQAGRPGGVTRPASASAPSSHATAAAVLAYARGLVRQTLERSGDDVELPAEGEPFELRAFGADGERFIFVRVDEAGAPTAEVRAFLEAHVSACWLALVQGVQVKVLTSGPQPLGGRVASLTPWVGLPAAEG